VASTKIPFTSESKEAISNVEEIRSEVERALRDCGRKLRSHLSKRRRKGKAQEKFDIVQQILPLIAEKSASIVGKPVPDITKVITKVMDIVQIREDIQYHPGSKTTTVSIKMMNYRPKAQKLSIHAIVPAESVDVGSISPKPSDKRKGGKLRWDFGRILSNEEAVVTFSLRGLSKGEWDETEFYVEGVDPVHLLGADPLPGDWDLDNGLDTTIDQFLGVAHPHPSSGKDNSGEDADFEDEGGVEVEDDGGMEDDEEMEDDDIDDNKPARKMKEVEDDE
ncbi:MAG: hypothetical protein QCI38_05795, partial [Candidatus Thermoplasmatota archaeon]|nr:hypothetical protein [Candidatus Thermoplasmatota archaeon]